jgi:serine/threonine-protein kinase RsbW
MEEDLAGGSRAVEEVLDSTLESVDKAEGIALAVARQSGFSEEDLDRIGMSVRECMVNAIVHGNRYSSHKKVRLSLASTPERFTVRIADQGEGFDPRELPDPVAEDNLLRQSGRGIFLMRAFMDDLQVRRLEPAGTEVTLVKKRGGHTLTTS